MKNYGGFFDLAALKVQIKALEYEMNQPDFWKNQARAREVSQKLDDLKKEVEGWEKLKKEVQDILEIVELDREEKDVNLRKEAEVKLQELKKRYGHLEFYALLNGVYDRNNAILAIHAGTGGVDAQDWAQMLLRMYLRFCDRKGFKTKIVDQSKGQEAGLKSASVLVEGAWAYGYLKAEGGVHRLVRISPFDAEKMRHTSFALLEVLPDLGTTEKVEIKDEELKIDTFRSSGHGGQSVNTTDSAVRITHLPSGITVTCQNERSQWQNKEYALKILKSRLYQLQEQKRQEKQSELRGELVSAEWGNQIRSYVLHPYKLVKDHRTKYEIKDPQRVLDGEIDDFIEVFLRKGIRN